MPTLYEQAAARVDQVPELREYSDIILYDWPEGEEHWQWVCDASVSEIVSWAEAVQVDDNVEE